MGKCAVKECNSRSQKHTKASGITFHTIPRDPLRKEKWMEIIRLLRKETDWIPSKTTVICSKHFRDQDKIPSKNDNGRVYLSNVAVPIIDDASNLEVESKLQVELTEFTRNENMKFEITFESDEEIDEITESPKKYKMRQTINHLKHVSTRRLKKIKSLLQKTRRLQTENKRLKIIIKELEKTMSSKE